MRYVDLIKEAKPEPLKHGSSRGHMGEYLIGSAVVAKLIAGKDPISVDDVLVVMRATSETPALSKTFTSVAEDEIEFINIIKNKKNIADAKDVEALVSVMKNELSGAVKFANSDQVAVKFSRIISKNGKPDRMLVKAAGEEDQSGTKADIFLIYKNPDGSERVVKGWSLKTGSNLVGQASPKTFEGMRVFFGELGINLKPIEGYDEAPEQHISSVYMQVVNDLKAMTNTSQAEANLVANLVRFMDEHIAKKDPRVAVVNLGKDDFSIQTIRKMVRNINTIDLSATMKQGGRQAILVHESGNPRNLLFQIRYTYMAPKVRDNGTTRAGRHRMFVETGPLFKQLATLETRDIQQDKD